MSVLRSFLTILVPGLLALSALAQPAVMAGDCPDDPSVTKVGDTYWASATSSNWFPAFLLLKSSDLRTWQPVVVLQPNLS